MTVYFHNVLDKDNDAKQRDSLFILCPYSFSATACTLVPFESSSEPALQPPNSPPPQNVNTMRWPFWSSDTDKDGNEKRYPVSWQDTLNATDWSHYTDPRNVIPVVLLTTTALLSVRLHRLYLRRIPEATYIRPGFFRKRSLFGTVTRVGDADNFHLFHMPGGRLTGWGWLRKIPEEKKALKGNTVCHWSLFVCYG